MKYSWWQNVKPKQFIHCVICHKYNYDIRRSSVIYATNDIRHNKPITKRGLLRGNQWVWAFTIRLLHLLNNCHPITPRTYPQTRCLALYLLYKWSWLVYVVMKIMIINLWFKFTLNFYEYTAKKVLNLELNLN